MQEGADGGFGLVHDLGDLRRGEFVERGKQQRLALEWGEAVDGVEDALRLLSLLQGLICRGIGRGEGLQEEVVGLLGLGAAAGSAAVHRKIPRDADEPGAEVTNGGEIALVLEHAQEGVLYGVFGFSAIAEQRMGDTKEGGGMVLNKRRQVHLGRGGFGELRQRQTEFLEQGGLLR